MIEQFQGEYRWLSNFAPVDIHIGVRTYPSVEHAFMAHKMEPAGMCYVPTSDGGLKRCYWREICATGGYSAGQIKKLSRHVTLRSDWNEMKLPVMEDCLRKKFNTEPFKNLLLKTGDQHIQEGNYWNDKFWGVCLKTGQGENHLGKLIMKIRDEIQGDKSLIQWRNQ